MVVPPFVDRRVELQALAEWCSRQRATPLYMYGPEGCGKTRLLREFTRRARSILGGDAVVVYIDALEASDVRRAILSVPSIPFSLVSGLVSAASPSEPIGKILSTTLSLLLDRLAETLYGRRLRDKLLVLIVDDVVKAIGVDRVEWYVKHLYELMWRMREEYEPRAVNFIVSTSEGKSLRLVHRHRHAHTALLWNLDRRGFEELIEKLGPPEGIDTEGLWRLLGGNPAKLLELAYNYEWGVERMLAAYSDRLLDVVRRVQREGLSNLLTSAIDDPDVLADGDSRVERLEEILVEANLVTRLGLLLDGGRLRPDPELGVGRHYAWQTPLYRRVLAHLLRQQGRARP